MLVEGQIKFNFDNHGYDDQGDIRRGGYFGFDPPSLVSGQLTVQSQNVYCSGTSI